MLRFLAAIAAFLFAGVVCELAVTQFLLYDIASNKYYRPQWESINPTSEELTHILERLQQPFYYFGSAKNHHAFISKDNTTVIKFFKQYDWQSGWLVHTPRKLDAVYSSCKIANEVLKQETGTLCMHLNKTAKFFGKMTLEDNLGFTHLVDLDATQFVIQKHAKPIFAKIAREIKRGSLGGAKKGISATLDILESICKKGIKIDSPPKRKNFGLVDEKVIFFEIDSFSNKSFTPRKELKSNTRYLRNWLKKYYPELYLFYNEDLTKRSY